MPHLVLLPGLNNTGAVFDGVVRALPERVTAHTPTLPALPTVEAIAQALLPELPPQFWLAGFSFGGYVALALLQAVPDRVAGIAMVCSAPQADTPEQRARRSTSMDQARAGGYVDMISAQAANAFHPDSLGNAALMQARLDMVRAYGVDRFLAHTQAAMERPDRSALLDGRRPTLVLGASHDKVFPPASLQTWASTLPDAQFRLIEGAGHLAPMEKPEQVAQTLADWVGAA